jgi:hypothetical protein
VAEIAEDYRTRGWDAFPLPWHAKQHPPKGITGYEGRFVTRADYREWANRWNNIGIVMPDTVIGIDADLYKDGNSAPTGLPPTVRSTNRTDRSGIYLFTIPESTKLDTKVEGVGEIIQWFHRYAVVWPSVHPEGRTYRWLDDDDCEVEIPYVEDLPALPEKWLKRLQARPRKHTGKGYTGDAEEWLADLPKGRPSAKVRTTLREAKRGLRRSQVTGASRYDVMVKNVGRLVALGARRQRGVERAYDELFTEYTVMIEGEPDRDPQNEVNRALEGAVAKWGAR